MLSPQTQSVFEVFLLFRAGVSVVIGSWLSMAKTILTFPFPSHLFHLDLPLSFIGTIVLIVTQLEISRLSLTPSLPYLQKAWLIYLFLSVSTITTPVWTFIALCSISLDFHSIMLDQFKEFPNLFFWFLSYESTKHIITTFIFLNHHLYPVT